MAFKYKLPRKQSGLTPEKIQTMGAEVDFDARKEFVTTPANTDKSEELENIIRYSLENADFSPDDVDNYMEFLYIERNNNIGGEFGDTPLNEQDFKKRLTEIVNRVIEKKEDRCKRIADRRYDKPSAYKSGAIVRCRQGKIWKDLKEEINELDISKHIKSWMDTKEFKRADNFPESIFLYLKKEGYINKGEIFRILNLDPILVIIKQNTEYIDLDKFVEDNQDIRPYDQLYSMFEHEKEVIARLDPNFSFEYIHHTDNTGSNTNMNLLYGKRINTNNFKNKLRQIILKKDQGKLLSFTKDRKAAQGYLEVIDDTLIEKYKLENDNDLEDNEDLYEDESLHKWFKRQGPKGKEGGWVDCNAPDGKGGYKACGRKKGEKRAKYPSCRPTPSQCKTKGKGKKWGKTK
jgi:hypothetical protein